MAASQSVADKFLTCAVCTEIFTDPRTLECQHTFCNTCLVKFTKTEPEALCSGSLLCPLCRELTKVPNSDKPVEEWPGQMKTSFLVLGLIDSFVPTTKDISHCSSCKEERKTTPATAWCSDCENGLCGTCARIHKSMPSTRHHTVSDLSAEVTRKPTFTCSVHKDEEVELFCKDCKKAICGRCCTLSHQDCQSVVTLEVEFSSLESSPSKNEDTHLKEKNEVELNPETLQDTIDVRVPDDYALPYPTDVTVLDVNGINTIVVTDNINNSLKSFYIRNSQKCHSKLILDGAPWSLTQLTHNQVVVTVPSTRQIVTVEVNPDLKLVSTITAMKKYHGITSLTPTTIAVGSGCPPCVDVMDLSGTILKSFTPHINNRTTLQYPDFLCTTKKGDILVSDWGIKSVLCMTSERDVVFGGSVTGSISLQSPRGITITSKGDILVADRVLNCVALLSDSGNYIRNILTSEDGVSLPYGLTVTAVGRLYVCLRYAGEIKVFASAI